MDTVDLNSDILKRIEDELRTKGAWAMKRGEYVTAHYYVARNKSIETAVSLCRSSVVTFSDIYLSEGVKKCLVCDLFSGQRLESEKEKIEEQEVPKVEEPIKPVKAKARDYRQSTIPTKTKKEKYHGNK